MLICEFCTFWWILKSINNLQWFVFRWNCSHCFMHEILKDIPKLKMYWNCLFCKVTTLHQILFCFYWLVSFASFGEFSIYQQLAEIGSFCGEIERLPMICLYWLVNFAIFPLIVLPRDEYIWWRWDQCTLSGSTRWDQDIYMAFMRPR